MDRDQRQTWLILLPLELRKELALYLINYKYFLTEVNELVWPQKIEKCSNKVVCRDSLDLDDLYSNLMEDADPYDDNENFEQMLIDACKNKEYPLIVLIIKTCIYKNVYFEIPDKAFYYVAWHGSLDIVQYLWHVTCEESNHISQKRIRKPMNQQKKYNINMNNTNKRLTFEHTHLGAKLADHNHILEWLESSFNIS